MEEVGAGPVAELPLCQRTLSDAVPLFPWGDLSSRCTNGNGVLDTEDLNGDTGLDLTGSNENVFRYIVDLAADSFFVRNGVTTVDGQGHSVTWKLYRIPIRQPSVTIGTPVLRLIQNLRLTVVTPPDAGQPDIVARLAMARLRFVGSPWVRRSETPILVTVAAPARVSVVDSGRGLNLGEHDALFEPFRRGSAEADGVGLGLSIVFQVMTIHQGNLAVRETPGGGTTVELSFPVEENQGASIQSEAA